MLDVLFKIATICIFLHIITLSSFYIKFHFKSKPKRSAKRNTKKPNFSKVIVVSYFCTALPLIIYTLIWSWKFGDSTPLCVVLTLVTGVGVAIVNGYFKKSQAENLLHIRKEMMRMDLDLSDIDMKLEENINEDVTINI